MLLALFCSIGLAIRQSDVSGNLVISGDGMDKVYCTGSSGEIYIIADRNDPTNKVENWHQMNDYGNGDGSLISLGRDTVLRFTMTADDGTVYDTDVYTIECVTNGVRNNWLSPCDLDISVSTNGYVVNTNETPYVTNAVIVATTNILCNLEHPFCAKENYFMDAAWLQYLNPNCVEWKVWNVTNYYVSSETFQNVWVDQSYFTNITVVTTNFDYLICSNLTLKSDYVRDSGTRFFCPLNEICSNWTVTVKQGYILRNNGGNWPSSFALPYEFTWGKGVYDTKFTANAYQNTLIKHRSPYFGGPIGFMKGQWSNARSQWVNSGSALWHNKMVLYNKDKTKAWHFTFTVVPYNPQ